MRYRRRIVLLSVGIIVLLVSAVWGVETLEKRSTVEVRPVVRTPQYQSDAARAISAYERLMERYMSLTEANLIAAQTDNRELALRLARLETSLVRIEHKIDLLSHALNVSPAAAAPQD